jgi:hypothetical protein
MVSSDAVYSFSISVLTSGAVSAIVTYILKPYLEGRIKHHFQIEIEDIKSKHEVDIQKLKSNLAASSDLLHEIMGRRYLAYPGLVEMVYRTRNIARVISSSALPMDSLVEEIETLAQQLEERIFHFRIDLERDGVFLALHGYKNTLKTFCLGSRGYSAAFRNGDKDASLATLDDIRDLTQHIEAQHGDIIQALTRTVSVPSVSPIL